MTAVKIAMLPLMVAAAILILAGVADAKDPLPDHPITGKPVQPTWSYWRVQSGPGWSMRCWVPARGKTTCTITLWWDASL